MLDISQRQVLTLFCWTMATGYKTRKTLSLHVAPSVQLSLGFVFSQWEQKRLQLFVCSWYSFMSISVLLCQKRQKSSHFHSNLWTHLVHCRVTITSKLTKRIPAHVANLQTFNCNVSIIDFCLLDKYFNAHLKVCILATCAGNLYFSFLICENVKILMGDMEKCHYLSL